MIFETVIAPGTMLPFLWMILLSLVTSTNCSPFCLEIRYSCLIKNLSHICNRHSLWKLFSSIKPGCGVRAFASRKQILSARKPSTRLIGIENIGVCALLIDITDKKICLFTLLLILLRELSYVKHIKNILTLIK